MRFAPTDDQTAFRDAVRDLLANQSDPAHVRWWWDGGPAALADSPVWRSLHEMGVVTALVPEARGGMGMGLVDVAGVLEEAGAAALPEPLVETAVVALPLLCAALDGAADTAGSTGASDPGAASSPVAEAEAGAVGEVLEAVLGGTAGLALAMGGSIMTAPQLAAGVIGVEPEAGGVRRLVLVPAAALEELVEEPSVDGARHLGRVRWGADAVVELATGDDADALIGAARHRGAVASALVLVGLADRMMAMTVDYVAERRQFGVPVGSFQAVKHHLADAALRLELAKPVVRHAAAVLSGVPVDPEHPLAGEPAVAASMAKAAASDAARVVADKALQCHGAIGYTVEHDLHLYLKRTWALSEAWGSAAWHRERIARRLLDGAAHPVADG